MLSDIEFYVNIFHIFFKKNFKPLKRKLQERFLLRQPRDKLDSNFSWAVVSSHFLGIHLICIS